MLLPMTAWFVLAPAGCWRVDAGRLDSTTPFEARTYEYGDGTAGQQPGSRPRPPARRRAPAARPVGPPSQAAVSPNIADATGHRRIFIHSYRAAGPASAY